MKRLLLGVLLAHVALGRFSEVSNPVALARALEPKAYDPDRLAAVYFYDKTQEKSREKVCKKNCKRQQFGQLRDVAAALPLEVVAADVSSVSMREMARDNYQVAHLPAVALFSSGRPVTVDGKTAVLSARQDAHQCVLFSYPVLERFIKKHLGGQMDYIIRSRAAYEQELGRIAASRPVVMPTYYGWGPLGGGPYARWWW